MLQKNQIETIQSISIQGIKKIGSYAFNGINNVKSLSLPFTLETIGHKAIQNMANLESVDFSSSIKSSASSKPIESLIKSGVTPVDSCSSGVNCW